mmetsp:Transcript_25652/g.28781  ORF Transcript_25652/g.28781 Transcript_25652/m.28781 type:complete len:134 (+) Transcript_25652:47-448(+)
MSTLKKAHLPEEINASVPATNQMPTTPKKRQTKKPKTTRGPPRVVAKVLNVPEIETVLTDRTTPPSSEEKMEDEPSSDVPSMKVISGSSLLSSAGESMNKIDYINSAATLCDITLCVSHRMNYACAGIGSSTD